MTFENHAICFDTLLPRDLPAALAIQSEAYPPFLIEAEDAFRSRMELAASYCLAARRGEELLGYVLAHGWSSEAPPPVGAVLSKGVRSEVLFIHDLASAPSGRGLGIGRGLVMRAFAMAARDGIRRAELIAVEGAADYWRGLGFVEGTTTAEMQAKLDGYGALARWMTRDIPSEQ